MKPEDLQVAELLVEGWASGVMTCLFYAAVGEYVKTKRRNRRHKILLDAGVSPQDILASDED